MADKLDYQYKILILGDATVGKTSILVRYIDNKFEKDSLATLGVDVKYKYVTLDNKKIRMNIWDTEGKDRFRNIAKNYFKGANAVIFVFDVNNKNTLDKIKFWIDNVKENSSEDLIEVIVGNKIDIEGKHEVTKEEMESLGEKTGMETFETSAKTGEGINEVFTYLVNQLIQNSNIGKIQSDDESSNRNSARPINIETFSKTNKPNHGCICKK
jgi:small GTP-binding protein